MGGEALGPVKACYPSVGEFEDREEEVGGCSQSAIEWITGPPMEELEKGLKELKGFTIP